MKPIVIYYSNTGSNKYLANKIAESLDCQIEEIQPRVNIFPLLLLSSKTGFSAGNKPLNVNLEEYNPVILVGPIWMGSLISPLYNFIRKYGQTIKNLYFVTCCGSNDDQKLEKFGHGHVFKKVESLMGDNNVKSIAFPIQLVLPDDKKEDGEAVMNTRLNDSNFNGEILERYLSFINDIQKNIISEPQVL